MVHTAPLGHCESGPGAGIEGPRQLVEPDLRAYVLQRARCCGSLLSFSPLQYTEGIGFFLIYVDSLYDL